jgi:UDP:flavonoid glycosyltransferase YjiC (YdhE family)
LVHHGGIGTLSQALAAGIPQLVVPFSHDQPDNADRIKRLGVGLSIHPRAYKTDRVAHTLKRLLSHEAGKEWCKEIARRFHEVDAAGNAVSVLEEFAARHFSTDERFAQARNAGY